MSVEDYNIDGEYPTREFTLSDKMSFPDSGCLFLINTEKEKRIELGNEYKFDTLASCECIVQENIAKAANAEVGDIIFIQSRFFYNFKAILNKYDEYAEATGK